MADQDKNSIRLAHLTDIHVAASLHAIFDALQFLALTIPMLSAFIYGIEKIIEKLPPGARVPARVITAFTGILSGGVAIAVSQHARAGLQFILALIFNYNRSISGDRRALLDSLYDNKVDHVVITGDLTNTARAEEFDLIRTELQQSGWWDERLTVLPGNHDKIGFPRSAPFERYFSSYLPVPGSSTGYPLVRELIPGVFLIGLDSCLPQQHEDVWDRIFTNIRGYLGADQIARLRDIARDVSPGLLVVGMHHPPVSRWARRWTDHVQRNFISEPENAKFLRAVFRDKPHLVLCGHDHPEEHIFDTVEQANLAVGTATGLRSLGSISYRIFTLKPDSVPGVETVELPVCS